MKLKRVLGRGCAVAAVAVGAVGMGVLAAAPASAHPVKAQPFKSAGVGTETPAAPGCQFTLDGCTVVTTGTSVTSHVGKGSYISTLTIDWMAVTPPQSNGEGGFCAPATGTAIITAPNGDTLNQTEQGTVCEVGPTAANAPHVFNGTFTNAGGTGRFSNASGGGTVLGGDDGNGNSGYLETGTISY